jgi:hypothetical protein
MLGLFDSGCRPCAGPQRVLQREPITMALVASASIAMNAGRYEPARRNYPMNHPNECSLLAV